jgi:hypothetical protein
MKEEADITQVVTVLRISRKVCQKESRKIHQ